MVSAVNKQFPLHSTTCLTEYCSDDVKVENRNGSDLACWPHIRSAQCTCKKQSKIPLANRSARRCKNKFVFGAKSPLTTHTGCIETGHQTREWWAFTCTVKLIGHHPLATGTHTGGIYTTKMVAHVLIAMFWLDRGAGVYFKRRRYRARNSKRAKEIFVLEFKHINTCTFYSHLTNAEVYSEYS